jgi:hypothetical protein
VGGAAAVVAAGGLAAVGEGVGEGVVDEQASADKMAITQRMDHNKTNLREVTFFIFAISLNYLLRLLRIYVLVK